MRNLIVRSILVMAVVGTASTDHLPGRVIMEHRLPASELDIDGMFIDKVYGVSLEGEFSDDRNFAINYMITEITNGSSEPEFNLFGSHRTESGYVHAEREELDTVQFVGGASRLEGRVFRFLAQEYNFGVHQWIDMKFRLEEGDYKPILDMSKPHRVSRSDSTSVFSVSSIIEGPFPFGRERAFIANDGTYGRSLFIMQGDAARVTPMTPGDTSELQVVNEDLSIYVYQDQSSSAGASTGRYFLTSPDWVAEYEIPAHLPDASYQSQPFTPSSYSSATPLVLHLEGTVDSASESGDVIDTEYSLVADRLTYEGDFIRDNRQAYLLGSTGKIVSGVSFYETAADRRGAYSLMFVQDVPGSGNRYITVVHLANPGEENTTVSEYFYEIPSDLHLEVDRHTGFSFTPDTSSLHIVGLWIIPEGHKGYPERIAAAVLLDERHLNRRIDHASTVEELPDIEDESPVSDPDSELPDDDGQSKPGDEAAPGSAESDKATEITRVSGSLHPLFSIAGLLLLVFMRVNRLRGKPTNGI